MANYVISGVWKDANNVITHYAVHSFDDRNDRFGQGTKTSKADAVRLLENNQNSAITVLWNYTTEGWRRGTDVNVVGTAPNKYYLRTTQDGTVRDNLAHLINYGDVTNTLN